MKLVVFTVVGRDFELQLLREIGVSPHCFEWTVSVDHGGRNKFVWIFRRGYTINFCEVSFAKKTYSKYCLIERPFPLFSRPVILSRLFELNTRSLWTLHLPLSDLLYLA